MVAVIRSYGFSVTVYAHNDDSIKVNFYGIVTQFSNAKQKECIPQICLRNNGSLITVFKIACSK